MLERLVSLLGLFVMIGLAWLMSEHKRKVSVRIVVAGLAIQFLFALLVLKTTPGKLLFDRLGDGFNLVLGCVDKGADFVFSGAIQHAPFAFKVLPSIIFFSALMQILYYLGIMQIIVNGVGWVVQRTLKTTGPESLAAAANIFLGQTEAPLVVKPYIERLTRSELMAIMVPGFGSTAGGVLAAYVAMGVDATHLLTASVLSAPAGLLIAKVLVPETERSQYAAVDETARAGTPPSVTTTPRGQSELGNPLDASPTAPATNRDTKNDTTADPLTANAGTNLLEAAAIGTRDGLALALNVGAMLIVFTALITLCDSSFALLGRKIFQQEWSLTVMVSYLFAPLAWVMGVESRDCLRGGELLGMKMLANEFVAYGQFGEWLKPDSPVALSERSKVILTYALCGFANFSSIGIQIGGIGEMAPSRRAELAQLGIRAMLGGALANFMTACIAGILI